MFFEGFGEIGVVFKTYGEADLRYGIGLVEKEDGCLRESHISDKLAGGKAADGFYFTMQVGATHADLAGQLFHAEQGITHVVFYNSLCLFEQSLVL